MGVFKAMLHADLLAASAARIGVDARELLFAALDWTPRFRRRGCVTFATGYMPLPDDVGIFPSGQWYRLCAHGADNHTLVRF